MADRKRKPRKEKTEELIAYLKGRVNELEREVERLRPLVASDAEHFMALRDYRQVFAEWRVRQRRRYSIVDGFEGLVKTMSMMISPKLDNGKEVAAHHLLQAMRVMIDDVRTRGLADPPKLDGSGTPLLFQESIAPCLRIDSKVPPCSRAVDGAGDYHTCRESSFALATK